MLVQLASLLVLISCAATAPSPPPKVDYSGHKLFGVVPRSSDELLLLQSLRSQFNFYELPMNVGSRYEVVVPPQQVIAFIELIKDIEYELDFDDLQSLINSEAIPSETADPNDAFWTQYQSLDAINQWLRDTAEAHSNVTRVLEIGKSLENRTILALEISHRPGNRAIFVEGNIHAREWITSASITWIINQLLTSRDPDVRLLAESVNWYFVPIINPDGFHYTHTTDRLWRKTRSRDSTTGCYGTDANRNFPFGWRENGGATADPCDNFYSGPEPLSETESRVLSDYVLRVINSTDVYLSVHSYGQYLLYPYGHNETLPPQTDADLWAVAAAAVAALANRYGTQYTFGQSSVVLYVASGNTVDYAYTRRLQNPPLAYTYELRDNGRHGFILPPDQIIPTAQETLDSLVALRNAALSRGYLLANGD